MDDAHDRREAKPSDVKSDDRLVGFHQEGETVFVAVRSYLPGVKLTDEIAKDLARDYLTEIGWFGEEGIVGGNLPFLVLAAVRSGWNARSTRR